MLPLVQSIILLTVLGLSKDLRIVENQTNTCIQAEVIPMMLQFDATQLPIQVFDQLIAVQIYLKFFAIVTVTQCANGDVRLAGGPSSNEGRVELCYNGVWGSVCRSYNNNAAAVICRQLGYFGSSKFLPLIKLCIIVNIN